LIEFPKKIIMGRDEYLVEKSEQPKKEESK